MLIVLAITSAVGTISAVLLGLSAGMATRLRL
jgi:hypothetical protein